MKTICGSSLFWLPAGGRDGGNGELRNEETAATITKWNATIIITAGIISLIIVIIKSAGDSPEETLGPQEDKF